jgi:hypothetical protein
LSLLGVAQALDCDHRADEERHEDAKGECASAGDRRDPVEAVPEDVAEEAEEAPEQPRAQHVVGKEPSVGHARAAGRERHQRPHETDPAAEEDGFPAMSVEVLLDAAQAILRQADPVPVPLGEAASELAAEHEADRVAGDDRRPDDADQEADRERPLAGQHAPEDDRELARGDEPEEGRGLSGRHEGDQQVRPAPERVGEVLDQVFHRRPGSLALALAASIW